MTLNVHDDGTVEKLRGKPFFDPDRDPLFDEWALSRSDRRALFISYHGWLYPISLTDALPHLEADPWPLASEPERAQGWRPGGSQPVAYHAPSHRAFVLMHCGAEWTQFEAGTEVWVFDTQSHRRIERVHLSTPAEGLAVTADDSPLLFTVNGTSRLTTYRERQGHWQHEGDLNEIGTGSSLLFVPER